MLRNLVIMELQKWRFSVVEIVGSATKKADIVHLCRGAAVDSWLRRVAMPRSGAAMA